MRSLLEAKEKNSLLFASRFSVQMKVTKKDIFSLCFASVSSVFASCFPLSLISKKVAKFFGSNFPVSLLSGKITPIFPFHFEAKDPKFFALSFFSFRMFWLVSLPFYFGFQCFPSM
jgi:hypothetical protein